MNYIVYRQITTHDPLYIKCVRLRRLRIWVPFHLLTSVNFEAEEEKSQFFVALLNSRKLIGCVLLLPETQNNKCIRLCQLAVEEAYCGQGIASKLINKAIKKAQLDGYEKIVLYAYNDIIPFFEKQGFQAQGVMYTHANQMQSVLMTKNL